MTTLHDLPADEGPAPALRDLVDDLAVRLAAWIVVDRRGDVLAHAPSPSPCPEPVARAILQRDASLLHQVWSARERSREVAALRAAGAGDGITVWTTGAAPAAADLEALRVAAAGESRIIDAELAALLEGLGPQRVGAAPAGRLIAVRAAAGGPGVARQALKTFVPPVRAHVEHPWVFIAAVPGAEVEAALTQVAEALARPLHAGVADVPVGASDWRATGDLARRLADLAREEREPWLSAQAPVAVQRLVVDEAVAAADRMVVDAGLAPLEALQTYDQRTGATLEATLRAWLQAGCDTRLAAESLHVHHNTLRYRLRRAASISGFDLKHPQSRLALWLLLSAADGRAA